MRFYFIWRIVHKPNLLCGIYEDNPVVENDYYVEYFGRLTVDYPALSFDPEWED